MTDQSKTGMVALVTGAGQGIGLAFAKRLASEGAAVIAVDRTPPPDLEIQLLAAGAPVADIFQADIAESNQITDCCNKVLDRHGRCDILVNNAGIYPRALLPELTLELWRRTMAINVESTFLFCQALAPAMIARNYGRIVNISSDTIGLVIGGFSHYMASKSAVIGFTRGLASELGPHGITANVIAPGVTHTPGTEKALIDPDVATERSKHHAVPRFGHPEDMAGAMSFLTSKDSAYVTGQTLIIDGGLLRSI